MEELFAAVAPGLEVFTAREIVAAGLAADARIEPEEGGVPFEGDLRAVYRANLLLRTASRVLVRVGRFRAAAFSELRSKASRLPWERFLTAGRAVQIRASCHKSKLYHSDAVAERMALAVSDRLGVSISRARASGEEADAPPPIVLVRVVRDVCTVSVDSSGALLHRRGYRLATAKAPLRETLAAGLIAASGWDGHAPLVDPFCGSGTIPIEAALRSRGVPPGAARRFAFMDWPCFDAALWERVRAEEPGPASGATPLIAGFDRDAGAVRVARENAGRAGLAGSVRFECRAISSLDPPAGRGFVVTNPPYGKRIGDGKALRDLYARLGDVLRERCPGFRIAVLCPDRRLLGALRFDLDTSLSFSNGGLRVLVARGIVETR